MQISTTLRPGDSVRVRARRWRVTDVRPFEECRLLTLATRDEEGAQATQVFIEPFEDVVSCSEQTVRRVSLARWRAHCRALIASAAPAGALRTAHAARIDLLPHQLEPALAILRGIGCRVLLADDVGLGKTVQAALIASELRARGAADRILILTPAGLRDQWEGELRERFGIAATVLDVPALHDRIAEVPVGMNPWSTVATAVASIDFVKRPEVLPVVAACRWDAVIVDEAHACSTDTDRFHAVAALSQRASWVIMATATPHSGDAAAFARLQAIGAHHDGLLVFRRTRDSVRQQSARRIHRLWVRPTRAERRIHRLLDAFARAITSERGDTRDVQLALAVLYKRALSSAWSLAQSIDRRIAVLRGAGGEPPPPQLALPFDAAAGETDSADEAPAWPAQLALTSGEREMRLLARLAAAARRAQGHESKMRAVRRLLARVDEPVLVFTEFRDTLQHVREQIGGTPAVLHGGLSRGERRAAIDAFAGGARLLLATDAGGEGLNLQRACRVVINLELPWNPLRLEQRIGRVDRIGQTRTVHVFHLLGRGTGEHRVLARARARVARARQQLPMPDPLGDLLDGRGAPVRATEAIGAVDLGDAASLEAERLALVRRVAGGGSTCGPPRSCLVARTRNRNTRRRLRSALLLFRVGWENGRGRPIATWVVGLQLPASLRGSADSLAPEVVDALRRAMSHASRVPAEEVIRTHEAFVAAQLARERAVALHSPADLPSLYQAGLFDRRADRARAAAGAIAAAWRHDSMSRMEALELESAVTAAEPELLLVLER